MAHATWPAVAVSNTRPVSSIAAARLAISPLLANVTIVALYAILFFRRISQLGYYSDDWHHLAHTQWPPVQLLTTWSFNYRPFDLLPWMWGRVLWGYAPAPYYCVLFLIQLATALVLFALLRDLLRATLLPLATALLWSVYPADASIFWLTGVAYRTGALFLLLAMYLLRGERAGRPWAYAGALVCCAGCLASIELYLGLIVALPLLAALQPATRASLRVARAAPFAALIALYLAYRLWLGPDLLHFVDFKANHFSLSGVTVEHAEVGGPAEVLLQAWQQAFAEAGAPTAAPTSADARALITFARNPNVSFGPLDQGAGLLYIAVLAIVALTWPGRRRAMSRWSAIRPGVLLLGLGAIGLFAGFAGLIATAEPPTLNGIASRLNAAATLGAALYLAGTLWVACLLLPLPARLGRALFAALALVCLAVAAIHTERLGATYAVDWQVQRVLWRDLAQRTPALAPDTYVLLTGADRTADDTIASLQSWGAVTALTALYPADEVHGDILPSSDIPAACAYHAGRLNAAPLVPLIVPTGIQERNTTIVVPTARVLVVRFHAEGRQRVDIPAGRVILGPGCAITSHPERIEHAGQAHGFVP